MLFEHAAATSTFTRESVASLFTGKFPSSSGATGWMAAPPDSSPVIAEYLQRAGYRTGFFVTAAALGDPAWQRGFDEVDYLAKDWSASGQSGQLTARALEFIKINSQSNFFLYLHYLDPHAPYDPPADLYREFSSGYAAEPLNLYQDLRPNLPQHLAKGVGPAHPSIKDMIDRYDAEIRDVDRSIETLIEGLRELGVHDRTTVVFVADHGEEFFDHGFVEHSWTVYNETLRIPLILWANGRLPGARVPDWVSNVDVLPTVLELLGISHEGNLDGEPLIDDEGGRYVPHGRQGPVIAELLAAHRAVSRAVIANGWKYIASPRWLTPEYRSRVANTVEEVEAGMLIPTWGPPMKEELFNLARDPSEQTNVIENNLAEVALFREALEGYRLDCCAAKPGRTESASAADLADEDRLRQLRTLGYVSGPGGPSKTVGSGASDSGAGPPVYEPGHTIPIGAAEAEPYLAYGWSMAENSHRWNDGNEAAIWFRADLRVPLHVEIDGWTFGPQKVEVRFNNKAIGTLRFGPECCNVRGFDIAADDLDSVNRIEIALPDAHSPASVGPSEDYRTLGIAIRSLRFTEAR